jgi:hypothetical protein
VRPAFLSGCRPPCLVWQASAGHQACAGSALTPGSWSPCSFRACVAIMAPAAYPVRCVDHQSHETFRS